MRTSKLFLHCALPALIVATPGLSAEPAFAQASLQPHKELRIAQAAEPAEEGEDNRRRQREGRSGEGRQDRGEGRPERGQRQEERRNDDAAERRAAEERAAEERAAERRAAEEKAAEERRAAEEKAAAERRAAEQKAAEEAEQKAAAERAAEQRAAEERQRARDAEAGDDRRRPQRDAEDSDRRGGGQREQVREPDRNNAPERGQARDRDAEERRDGNQAGERGNGERRDQNQAREPERTPDRDRAQERDGNERRDRDQAGDRDNDDRRDRDRAGERGGDDRRDRDQARDRDERRGGDRDRASDDRRGPGGAGEVLRRSGDRIILRLGNGELSIQHDDDRRFRRDDADVDVERRRNGDTVTTVSRPGGVEIVTIRDQDGNIIRRVRRGPDGRESVLIGDRDRNWDRPERRDFRDRPYAYGRGLPPLRVDIPRHQYIVESRRASPEDLRMAFEAPPVEVIERSYTLEEIRESERLRDKLRRVDLDTITFDTGSAEVPQDQIDQLDRIGRVLSAMIERNPDEIFLVEGHTDAVGSNVSNLELSDRRAESVAMILTDYYDIPPENLITQGYGEEQLKIETQAAERQNRRVTMRRITPLLVGQR